MNQNVSFLQAVFILFYKSYKCAVNDKRDSHNEHHSVDFI